MRLGTCNKRSLYRSGSLKTVARELAKHKLTVVGVQEVSWDKDSLEPTVIFSCKKENAIYYLGMACLVHAKIRFAVKRVEFCDTYSIVLV